LKPARYDVAVVGASIAGCTAARLFALRGARVALIERRPDLDAYKTVCTHYVQASATPTIERLGLAPLLEQRGAIHNSVEIWTRYGGWIPAADVDAYGYSLTRQKLDPALRTLTTETPGVDLLAGWTATGLQGGDRPAGVTIEDGAHESRQIDARLIVAADGRQSGLARLAGVPARVKPNRRFFYWAYWRGLRPGGDRSRMWLLEPDCAYTFPNEDGLTIALVAPHVDRLADFRLDRQAAYMRMLRSLPQGPEFAGASQESKLLGKLELPNAIRPAARPGLAFVGDAALAADPLWGIGCGWAFQSAEWLVDETAPALLEEGDLDAALDRYRRLHLRRLGPHHFQIADFAGGRPANLIERVIWRAAARDPEVRRAFDAVGSRRAAPTKMMTPRMVLRQARAAFG
jgi:2-polyprenyl-6-methoxyphenol hydroxylase-like FAD-dependent oxidoreductase